MGGVVGRIKDIFSKAKDPTLAQTSNGFMGLLTDNSITLKNMLLSAVVVGLEKLMSSEVFDCPLRNHKAYGTSFLVAPVFIVFFTNLAILGQLSKLTDRCCIDRYRRWGDFWGRVIPNVVKAMFGPCVWLVTSFADTTYYVCRQVGQPIEKRNMTNETAIKILEEKFADAKSTSIILAWVFFTGLVVVTAIVIISKKCMLKDNELLEDEFILERREAFTAMEVFRERARDFYKQDGQKNENAAGTDNTSASEGVNPTTASTVETPPVPSNPEAITTAPEADNKNEEDKKEEVTLYPHGIPELFGKKRVEELFKEWSTEENWHYLDVYEKFAGMYPRITSGKPCDAWVDRSKANANVLKTETPPS